MQTGYFRVFKYIKMKRPKSTVNELRGPHAQADQIAASLSGMEDSHLQAGPNMIADQQADPNTLAVDQQANLGVAVNQ